MLQYQKIDVSEGIDVNKTRASKECELCHYWFFKDVRFKFDHVCNGCHDLLTMTYSLKNLANLRAKGATLVQKSWKEFVHLKNIDAKFYASDYYDVNVNKYGVKCGKSLRYWENKGWINKIDSYGWFQWYFRYWLGRRSKDDKRQTNKNGKNCE